MEQLITKEKYTSIHEAQAGLTKLLEEAEEDYSFYRVMKSNKPIGILMPTRTWESLLEDFQALNSPSYLKKIATARRSRKKISLAQIKRGFKL